MAEHNSLDPSYLEDTIGYNFKNRKYLMTALTHSSYANESRHLESNERLEFLGDAVLSIVVSEHLYAKFRSKQEGELTRLRASLVCENTLYGFAKKIQLGEYIRLGHGEIHSGGNKRPSILADGFEALIAAIFLDGGMEEARRFILEFITDDLIYEGTNRPHDYKTMLQEIIQQNAEENLSYVLVGESGPDHNKHFSVEVHLNSNVIGKGGGRSKKEAEQNAAKEALELMGY